MMRHVRKLGLIFLGVLLTALPREAAAIELTENLTLNGYVHYEHFSFIKNTGSPKIDSRNEVAFHTEWVFYGDDIKAFVAPEFRFDGSDEDRNDIFLDEAWMDYYSEYVDFRIGKQIISWGRADTIRPTDVWKIKDFTDFFEEEEEGIVALQARGFVGDFTLTGIWVPYFQPDTLPLTKENSRFFPSTFFPTLVPNGQAAFGLTSTGPYNIEYVDDNSLFPDDGVKSSEFGAKIDYTWEGWDFSLSYGYLHDRIATFFLGPNFVSETVNPFPGGTSNAVFALQEEHSRIHMIATDGATTVGQLGIRWEAAYFITSDHDGTNPLIDDPYLQATGGFDYTFTNVIGDQDVMILIQYATDQELPKQGQKNIRAGANLRHFFEHATLSVIEWKFSEYFKIQARAFINLRNADHQIEPEVQWSPADGLTLTVTGQIVGGIGGKDSFFTAFEDEDRVQARVEYAF